VCSSDLEHSLATCVAIDDPNLEIIVTDNCSTDGTEEVIKGCPDPRVKYVRTSGRVSMRANFENGLNACTGEYISFIGDDDGYIPGQFRFLRQILEQEKPDCMFWNLPTYTWPRDGRDFPITLRRRNLFGTLQEMDADKYVRDLLAARIEPTNWAPAIYHGMMSRAFLDKASLDEGVFFAGSIPDIYSGYRAVLARSRILKVAHPFSLGGQSSVSNGVAHSANDKGTVGKTFINENQTDRLRDILSPSLSLEWVLFSTLQTLRHHFPNDQQVPDYTAWYRFILSGSNGRELDTRTGLLQILTDYANQSGTLENLASAQDGKTPRKNLADKIRRELSNVWKVKVSGAQNGENTILSAVNMCDTVLSDNYANVLSGKMSRAQAWAKLRKNARQFKRTL